MDSHDEALLTDAVKKLEHPSFAMSVANRMGMPLDAMLRLLPDSARSTVANAVNKALERCLHVALLDSGRKTSFDRPRNALHSTLTAATGAAGGFFGIGGLAIELPVTTTLILHSIAEIARSHGEDLRSPEGALACLEVFALGSGNSAVESTYYATRAVLAQATREAAAHIAQKGLSNKGAPALVQFLSRIATRFGIEVTEKAAAQLVPVAGAVGGLSLNLLFTAHFQKMAEGHFAVRMLERKYGADVVKQEYDQRRTGDGADRSS